jgi:hypothetical protein
VEKEDRNILSLGEVGVSENIVYSLNINYFKVFL